MNNLQTKNVIWIILFLALTFQNLSCINGKRAVQDSEAPKKKLDFRITWQEFSGRGEAIQKIVRSYNEKNSADYEIVVKGGDEDFANLESLLKKNKGDTLYMLPYRYVQYFGAHGYLLDLSSYFQAEKDLFYPALWKLGQVNGRSNGIPWLGHSICLIYNKNLLAQAGVDAGSIKDLASFLSALERVEAKTNAKGVGLIGANHNDVSWMVNQFIYGYGSTLVDETGRKVNVNNEKARQALSFYKNVLGPHAQATWADDTGMEVMSYFRKQEIAFEFQGVWGVSDIAKNGNPFKVGVIALEDIGLYAEVGPMMLAIPKNMDESKKEAALEFIQFLISKEAQEKIMDGEYSPEHDAYYPFRTPVRKDLEDRVVFKKYPEYIPFIKGFERPSIDVPVPAWQTVKEQYYAPGLHQVMKSEISIEDFLEMIQEKGDEVLASS